MDTQNAPWIEIYDGPSTSQYQSNGQQGLFAYRVRACKVFACSASWSNTLLVMHTDGEDCEPLPMIAPAGQEAAGDAGAAGDVVIMAPPCPIEP